MVEQLSNEQYKVVIGNITLIQTLIKGQKFNDVSIKHSDYSECISSHDERAKPLFIELHNYKGAN